MKNFYRIDEAAKIIGVSSSTLRKYADTERIASSRNPGNQRIFTLQQIQEFLGIHNKIISEDSIVFYVRSSDDDTKIDAQVKLLTEKYGEPVKVFKDKTSGLNEKRPGLASLINQASKHKFNTIAITQKDRLTRFGYSYLETLFANLNVKIIVLGENKEKTLQDELLQDFMSLITSFSGKIYRLRGYEQQHQLLQTAQEGLYEKQSR